MYHRSIITGAAASIVAVVAALALAGPVNATGPVKPMPAPASGASDPGVTPLHCGGHTPHDDIDQRSYARLFTGDSVNIRAYPHVGCTSHGYGYRTHTVDYHCWRFGDSVTRNGLMYQTWTYLRNVTTGVSGWVSDAYLAANGDGTTGSTIHCDD